MSEMFVCVMRNHFRDLFLRTRGRKKVAELLFDKRKQFVLLSLESRVSRLKMMDIDEGVNYLFNEKYIIECKGWNIILFHFFTNNFKIKQSFKKAF